MTLQVKICGLTTPEAVEAAGGADLIGFVFYPPSPRHITFAKAAALKALTHVPAAAVTVDPDDDWLETMLEEFTPDYIQLHGNEPPERVAEVKMRFGIPVIKAIRVHNAGDLALATSFEPVADMLMFDAGVAGGLPGGNGKAFDWPLLADKEFRLPWFLSGGLTPDTVKEAARITHAARVDVSSSLERSPGVKDPALVRAFIHAVKHISLQ